MAINITHTMNNSQFESRENLRNAAKDILNRQGANKEASQKIMQEAIFTSSASSSNAQLSIIKASSQISMNNSLKETLKYLKSYANKKIQKQHTLGDLWSVLENNSEKEYNGELIDFIIDNSKTNIFAA